MEVTGQDSTLYLLAAKLIISQTFHYTNQTTASSLAPSLASFAGSSGKQGGERKGDIRAAICDGARLNF